MSPHRVPGRSSTSGGRAAPPRAVAAVVAGLCGAVLMPGPPSAVAGPTTLASRSASSAPAGRPASAAPADRRASAALARSSASATPPGAGALRPRGTSVRADGRTLRFVDRRVQRATRLLTGELVGVGDGPHRYVVQTATGRQIPVRFRGGRLPDRAIGARVQARASRTGAVRSATLSTRLRRIGTATPSAHRAYVALISNRGAFASSDATITDTIDEALNRWREESNGAITTFERVKTEPLALKSTNDCKNGSANYNEAQSTLFPGVDTGSTTGNHVIVVGPQGCATGVGTLQAGIASGGRLNAAWDPTETFQTFMHELGHNFSLNHAGSCYAPLGPDCKIEEYGNTYALMGYTLSHDPAYTPAALDSFERARLGITDAGEVAPVALAAGQRTTTSTYDLHARGTPSGLRGLRITDPTTGTVYSIDWRSGGGRDALSGYASNPVKDNYGVTVERVAADGKSAAVLGNANPDPSKQPLFGLTAGRSFSAGGTTITVQSLGAKDDPNATSRVGVTLTDPSVAPDTSIADGPAEGATVPPGVVTFAFAGTPSDATAGFECRLDGGAWEACTSPRALTGLADGTHTFAARARDAAGHVDATPATRTFVVRTPSPTTTGGAGAGGASGSGPTTPGGSAAPAAALEPAKLEVTRATVSSARRRLSIVAPITARASGVVRVAFRAAGRTTTFDAQVDARRRRVTVDRRITAAQARAGTGIVTLTYRGDADTQPQTVRLRAASRAAGLRAGRPTLTAGRLRAAGRVSARARGVVRVQLLFEPATGATRTLGYTARITRGRYRLDRALPADVQAAIALRRGVLHSYTLFTGDLGRGLRGELASYQVLGRR